MDAATAVMRCPDCGADLLGTVCEVCGYPHDDDYDPPSDDGP